MSNSVPSVRVAVVQIAPVAFDHNATLEKVLKYAEEAKAGGANLILFPEAMIPGYPRGFSFGMSLGRRDLEGRKLWQRFLAQSVEVPGPATEILANTARRLGVVLALGVMERDRHSQGTMYCSYLMFNSQGVMVQHHRKLKPTGAERLIWGEGDGKSLRVIETELGRIGGLICWENYMPLARMALYRQGVQIYLAPTADFRDSWIASMRHIACEGRCFVLACNQVVTKADYPDDLVNHPEIAPLPDQLCRGGSLIVNPLGDIVAGPIFDREEMLFADLDLGETVQGKLDFDVAGHYHRSDVFEFQVRGQDSP